MSNKTNPRTMTFNAFLKLHGHGIAIDQAVNDKVYTQINGVYPAYAEDEIEIFEDENKNNWVIAEPREWTPHEHDAWPANFAELSEDTLFHVSNLITGERGTRTVKAGTSVRIVMASRFGDVGITDDLSKSHGYNARLRIGKLKNLRLTN